MKPISPGVTASALRHHGAPHGRVDTPDGAGGAAAGAVQRHPDLGQRRQPGPGEQRDIRRAQDEVDIITTKDN